MARNRILIVDDDAGVRFGMGDYLTTKGYEVAEAVSGEAAQEAFRNARPDAVVLDYLLPDGNALDLLPRLKAIDPDVPVLILTAHGSIDLAVRAMKEGAEQFLTKPVELPTLEVVLARCLDNQRNRQRQLAGRTRDARRVVDPFLGTSAAMRRLAESARKVRDSDSPILIEGETGTGKGVLAAWLHATGPRADEAFVDLNCAGLNREFLETELFGHEKGAFTGASAPKQGLLEVAHRGTVFLDEIGDIDPLVQPKVLKVLEEKRFRRLGDVRDRQVDIRLIAATHHDLTVLVGEKKFREDLYFRISTLPLRVPPLRERADDIPPLAAHLLQRLASDLGRSGLSLTPEAVRTLQEHPWPGNVRELRNVLERAALLSDRGVLMPSDLVFRRATVASVESTADGDLTLADLERRHIERVLRAERGRVDQAAKRLGIPRSSLYQKIRKMGIPTSRS